MRAERRGCLDRNVERFRRLLACWGFRIGGFSIGSGSLRLSGGWRLALEGRLRIVRRLEGSRKVAVWRITEGGNGGGRQALGAVHDCRALSLCE